MSNNISSLFENLMAYNDSHSKRNIKRNNRLIKIILFPFIITKKILYIILLFNTNML